MREVSNNNMEKVKGRPKTIDLEAGKRLEAKGFFAADKSGQDQMIVCICTADADGADILTPQASGNDCCYISGKEFVPNLSVLPSRKVARREGPAIFRRVLSACL